MNIVACIKRVPTTEYEPKLAADGKSIDPGNTPFMLSFYDEIAVEQANLLKEKHGGEVTVLSMGPADVQKELRECLAKGADKGVILKDDGFAARDALTTAKALAHKLKDMGAELILTGRVATDRDNAAVGPMLAELLGYACVTDVVQLEFNGDQGTAKRETEAGLEVYEFKLPAVITCQKGLAEPRYAGLKGIMAAKKKPIEELPAHVGATQVNVIQLSPPPRRPAGRIVGSGVAAVPALIQALRSEAKVL